MLLDTNDHRVDQKKIHLSIASAERHIADLVGRSGIKHSLRPIDDLFLATITKAEGKKSGNPEFDCSLHDFDERNSFWICLSDDSSSPVGTVACRRIEHIRFLEDCRSYRLWYGETIRFANRLAIIAKADSRLPNGIAAFQGAAWVHPRLRGRGVSWALTRLANLIAAIRWQPDWFYGIAYEGIARSRLPIVSYGFPSIEHFASGFQVPGYARQELYLATLTWEELCQVAHSDSRFLAAMPELRLAKGFGDHLRHYRHTYDEAAVEIDQPASLAS